MVISKVLLISYYREENAHIVKHLLQTSWFALLRRIPYAVEALWSLKARITPLSQERELPEVTNDQASTYHVIGLGGCSIEVCHIRQWIHHKLMVNSPRRRTMKMFSNRLPCIYTITNGGRRKCFRTGFLTLHLICVYSKIHQPTSSQQKCHTFIDHHPSVNTHFPVFLYIFHFFSIHISLKLC